MDERGPAARSAAAAAPGPGDRLGDRRRKPRADLLVEFAQLVERREPLSGVAPERLAQLGRRDIESIRVEGAGGRDPPDRCLLGPRRPANPLDHPLEDAHVFAITGPEEAAVRVAAEPVDAEDAGRLRPTGPGGEPLAEIVGHVVAAERDHGHGITAHYPDLARD